MMRTEAGDDVEVTFRTQKGKFHLSYETLSDPFATAQAFARIYRLIDNLRAPYGRATLGSYRKITSEREPGGLVHTWRLIWLIKA